MNTKKTEGRKIFIVAIVVLGVLMVCLMYGMDIIRMIDWQIPNEIREGANIAMVNSLVRGENPYKDIMTGGGSAPGVFYMYPILNNLIAAAVVRVTGAPAGLVLLVLNMLWTIITSLLITAICAAVTKNRYLLIFSFILSHYCAWRYTNCSAFPDMLAVLLMTVIMYICMRCRITGKHIIVLSLLTTLCFYSKQYAVVILVPVAVWLWLKCSKKKSLSYVGLTALLGGLSALLIYIVMPLYFLETVFLLGDSADNSFRWAIVQFIKMGKQFFLWYMLAAVWLLRMILKKKEIRIDYVFIHFVIMAIFLIYFGQNEGAHLSYYLQMWFPATIILAIRMLDELTVTYCNKWQEYVLVCVALVCAIYPYYYLHTPQLTDEQKENWARVYEIAGQNNVLATPQQSSYAANKGEYMYDYGQNQYILRNEAMEYWNKLEDSQLLMSLFPQALELKKVHEDYRLQILDRLENGEYDTLMLIEGMGFLRDWDAFVTTRDKYYQLSEEIELETGAWKWNVGIWEKVPDNNTGI